MPKLPVIKPLQLIALLEKNGFVIVASSGSHRIMKNQAGKRTVVPVHAKDVPTGTLLAILRDIEISKAEFEILLKPKLKKVNLK